VTAARDHPERVALAAIGVALLALLATYGLHDVAQTGLNGLALGAVYALGAVGLTLVYGILKLVNFAHGEFLTFGAYVAFVVNVSLGLPLVLGALAAVVATAALGVAFERAIWAPMRGRGAGLLQLLIMAIGLAFVIRYTIQFFASTEIRTLDTDRTATVELLGLVVSQTELIVIVVGAVVIATIGVLLRSTLLGKQMRALSDDAQLAETAGIDTARIVLLTWLLAGGTAGLAGVFAGALTDVRPELGFALLLAIFAAVVLGGIGDVFGALVAGVALGVVIEWSTLVIDARFKIGVGFLLLIVVLLIRPQGIFGRAKAI
jgi:neutral amino acid transport system permease protein